MHIDIEEKCLEIHKYIMSTGDPKWSFIERGDIQEIPSRLLLIFRGGINPNLPLHIQFTG